MYVQLNKEMIKNKLGFIDPENGQRIYQSHKSNDEKTCETIEVEETEFIHDKLANGELVLPQETKKNKEPEEPELSRKEKARRLLDLRKKKKQK